MNPQRVKNPLEGWPTLPGTSGASQNRQILERLHTEGRVFIKPTVYKGLPNLRAALVNWRKKEVDIRILVDLLIEAIS